MNRLPRSTPEAQGVSSTAVARFVDALEHGLRHTHSFMLLRHGTVIAEGWWAPYEPQLPHSLFSISKSFTSTAVGFAIEEGLLSLDDTVLSLLPDDAPAAPGPNLAAMTVRHLLTMTTGHAADTVPHLSPAEDNWARTLLALPVALTPGTTFVYNTGATFLLSAILQRLTGARLLDYLTPRLLAPLGIADATWEQSPLGVDAGGWGLSVTTEDIARFGLLYLNGGVWHGEQLVPAHWVAEATSLQVENGDFSAGNDGTHGYGYGYQFWRSQHGAYRADGAFGQLSIALAEQDTLLVLTGGLADMQREMNVVWDHLLPVLGSHSPLPDDAASAALLSERLSALTLPTPDGELSSTTADRVAGVRYSLSANAAHISSVVLEPTDTGTVIVLGTPFGDQRIACGFGVWTSGTASLMDATPASIAAAGGWADHDSFIARICLRETPFSLTLSLDFRGDEVTVNVEQNVSFGPTQLVHVVGRA